MPLPIKISSSTPLLGDTTVLKSSSFFSKDAQPRELPTPAEVRAEAASRNIPDVNPWRPPPLTYPSLNLLVKYGRVVSVNEGQCLWVIRKFLDRTVPVPEVFGWCQDEGEAFIYMELVEGSTLEQRWDELTALERSSICDQLRPMIAALRTLKQSRTDCFVGNVNGGPLQDTIFDELKRRGPFSGVSSFHDWFVRPRWANESDEHFEPHEFRQELPNDPITFTHGDLHRSNILVSSAGKGPPRITAIVDWQQSGWYPAYWEYCKARWTAPIGDEWVTTYLAKIMQPRLEVYNPWNYFVLCHGM